MKRLITQFIDSRVAEAVTRHASFTLSSGKKHSDFCVPGGIVPEGTQKSAPSPSSRRPRRRWIAIGAIALSWLSLIPRPATAQNPPDFSGTGRSRWHIGGASRSGACAVTDLPMMPLAPAEAGFGGHTIEGSPTVWVYVPFEMHANSPATFALFDNDRNEIYQTEFVRDSPAGVYGIELPSTVELAVNDYYEWYFLVYCNDPNRLDVPAFASGWVQRVEVPETLNVEHLDTMHPIDRSSYLANHLLWYDALTPLAEMLHENQENSAARSAWADLLSLPSVQLDEFSNVTVSSCCDQQGN